MQRITSSRRYKNNIRDVELTGPQALDIVDLLRPRLWEDYKTGETVIGLIAEEVYEAAGEHFVSYAPWAVKTEQEVESDGDAPATTQTVVTGYQAGNGATPVTRDGGPLTDESEVVDGLKEKAIIAALLKSVQELKARVEALEGA